MIRRGRKSFNVKKLAAAGLLTAVAVACSPFSIPVGASQCFPVQHMVNVLALAVDSGCRRQGIGRALLAAGEQWAKSTGAAAVRLVSGETRARRNSNCILFES